MPTVTCNCGGATFTLNCDELSWECVETEERHMGTESTYVAEWETTCSQCEEDISVTYTCWEYPPGALNAHETDTDNCTVDTYCCPDFSD